GHVYDGTQLGERELLVDGMVHFGQYSAGRANLDQLGVAAQLFARCLRALGRSVAQPQIASVVAIVGDPRQGIGVQVAVPAGRGQDGAGSVDIRADHGTFVNRPRKVDADSTHLSHTGDAGIQRGPQVTDRAGGAQGDRVERRPVLVEAAYTEEVGVTVP